ncbi:sigma-70 family RNA polymerase sigma factor [Streptomyces sp. TRM66268-LWL]|uniref:Sigma-70 family RNA polymerase sigma factor n=1 Tax=Streptomyces polyasparticus TaxID=2767826 RepID=A0ABR7SMK3_9ACTN|nr:sigma-70 family RNA polymerase sigma factor [Streptomyces polyasparticus]MBC9715573.1 sigma-70 family RNA polymerase sigma factor [Streptomyces polyasparticus]
MNTSDLLYELRPLLKAEAAAEAPAGIEPADLEQDVWLRLLERIKDEGPPAVPADWLRRTVRGEARRLRRTTRIETRYEAEPAAAVDTGPEGLALRAEHRRALHAAVRRLPGRCPRLLAALLSREDLTYREIAGELGISQGSLGPERSRCLGCLRRILAAEVAAPGRRGKVRFKQPADR